MSPKLRVVVLACVVAAAWTAPCEAFVRRLQFPLSGHRNYGSGSGQVTFSESFGDVGRSDGVTLIVEVNNVPLPPGTELAVLVHEKQVGRLKLDKLRNGRLVLESGPGRRVPRLSAGSFVTVALPAGATVLW